MNAIKTILLLMIFICAGFPNGILAQSDNDVPSMRSGQLKSFGKNAFSQGDYASAALYYESFLDKKPNNYKINYKLAESYRLSKDYRNAKVVYLKAYELNPKKNSLALFHYATMLKMTGEYSKSDEYYAKFRKEYRGKDKSTYLKLIGKNTKAAEFVSHNINNPVKISIERLGADINTNLVEAAPFFINDSSIIYSAIKTDQKYFFINTEDATSNEPFRKIYVANREGDKWIDKNELDGPFNVTDMHVSNGVFSNDGQRFYFTKCKRNKKNKTICSIYVSNQIDGVWQEPVSLGNLVNAPGSTNTQPTIGTESQKNREIIYFVSDRDGGRGGLDIWYTYYDSRKKVYQKPMNAGVKLNTPGDEVTPYYDMSTRTLYFSSDGWQGLGGLDVFKTNGEMKKWTTPENLGSPLNSSYDDLYYVLAKKVKETGMFVSNRENKGSPEASVRCCDDIFYFQWLDAVKLEVRGKLYDVSETGTNLPVKGAKVFLELKNVEDSTYIPVDGNYTDTEGGYSLSLIPNREYRLITKKEGYLSNVTEFNTNNLKESGHITIDINISEAPLDAIPLQNIYYDFAKATLTEAAKLAIDTTLLLILANNPDLVIEISSHTDHIGSDSDNLKLSQDRAESVVNYLIEKGIERKLLNARGFGETKPIAPNQFEDGSDNPEGRQLNRRTEFRIIGKMMPDGKISEPGSF